jgi:hypothetical protein
MVGLNNAKLIKAIFIDFLTQKQFKNYSIGSEISFADKKVLADLVLLSNMECTAYEIKANNDDLRRLQYQLATYNEVFDFVNLIITEKHFLQVRKVISPNNGIIIITNNECVEIFRSSKQNKKLNKDKIISTMTINFLKKYFNINNYKYNGKEIKNILQKKDVKELRNAMYIFLYCRINRRYMAFLREKGIKTHFEDVSLLSLPNKRIILPNPIV